MELKNCLLHDPETKKPLLHTALKRDEDGLGVPMLDDKGEQRRDKSGNLMWEGVREEWGLFDFLLHVIGRDSTHGWVADDYSIWSRLSGRLRDVSEAGVPVEEQKVKLKDTTFEWIKKRLQGGLTNSNDITADTAAVVYGILDEHMKKPPGEDEEI